MGERERASEGDSWEKWERQKPLVTDYNDQHAPAVSSICFACVCILVPGAAQHSAQVGGKEQTGVWGYSDEAVLVVCWEYIFQNYICLYGNVTRLALQWFYQQEQTKFFQQTQMNNRIMTENKV